MARIRPQSIKDGFRQLFLTFLRRIGKSETDDPFLSYRFIDFDKKTDGPLFGKSVIKAEIKDIDGNMMYLLNCANSTYLILVGYHEVNMPSNIVPIVTSTGLFLTIILERQIPIKKEIDNLRIDNEIFYPIENTEDPAPYSLDDCISNFFPEISIFRIDEPITDYQKTINRLAVLLYCNNSNLLRIDIPTPSLSLYCTLVNRGYDNLNYDNIWRSISSSEWRYCFIELYRCIEIVFNIARTFELSDSVKSKLSFSNLFSFSWQELRSYYHEDIALRYLFGQLSQSTVDIIKLVSSIKNADGYYRLRNAIVHGKRNEYYTEIIKKQKDWNSVIDFSLLAIDELLGLYDDDLSTFDESVVKMNRRN